MQNALRHEAKAGSQIPQYEMRRYVPAPLSIMENLCFVISQNEPDVFGGRHGASAIRCQLNDARKGTAGRAQCLIEFFTNFKERFFDGKLKLRRSCTHINHFEIRNALRFIAIEELQAKASQMGV